MIAILGYFLSALLSVAQLVWHPVTASCPRPLWLARGVQPDGTFGCWLSHEVSGSDTPDARLPTSSYDGVVWSRIWCAHRGDARQDGVRVWCARGGAGS